MKWNYKLNKLHVLLQPYSCWCCCNPLIYCLSVYRVTVDLAGLSVLWVLVVVLFWQR